MGQHHLGSEADAGDAVDRILAQWHVERPDLDVSPIGVVGRLHRVAALLDDGLRVVFEEFGLGAGDFDVLATLRRAGAPYTMSPGEIQASTMVTSGAVTKRVDRLEKAGWVQRVTREDDARGRRISLTPAGVGLVDEALARHVANEERLLRALDGPSRVSLAALLSTLMQDLEGGAS